MYTYVFIVIGLLLLLYQNELYTPKKKQRKGEGRKNVVIYLMFSVARYEMANVWQWSVGVGEHWEIESQNTYRNVCVCAIHFHHKIYCVKMPFGTALYTSAFSTCVQCRLITFIWNFFYSFAFSVNLTCIAQEWNGKCWTGGDWGWVEKAHFKIGKLRFKIASKRCLRFMIQYKYLTCYRASTKHVKGNMFKRSLTHKYTHQTPRSKSVACTRHRRR